MTENVDLEHARNLLDELVDEWDDMEDVERYGTASAARERLHDGLDGVDMGADVVADGEVVGTATEVNVGTTVDDRDSDEEGEVRGIGYGN